MLFIIHEGYEMKARTRKSLETWFRKQKINVSIDWKKLRMRKEVISACDRWYIAKVDGREYTDVPFIYPCNWTRSGPKGGELILPFKYQDKYGF